MLISTSVTVIYHVLACGVYGCILAILLLALIFGRRARRNVKKEKITSMPEGFSPLDVKRIFIGRTYPRRLTRALITHWANCGYISVKYINKHTVHVNKIKNMPKHDSSNARFFDRGTYVRECDLFRLAVKKFNRGHINLYKPLFDKDDAKSVRTGYATREDDGVYSSKHYSLKIATIALSILPSGLCALWSYIYGGMFFSAVGLGTALIGLFVLMFVRDMPILFKAVWCGGWLAGSLAFILSGFAWGYDPLCIIYVSTIILFVGPLLLIRFVDFREKINLKDYSDLVNYRKFLARSSASELASVDYYKVLPMLYAFGIKSFVKRKYIKSVPPEWYHNDDELKGALL